MHGVDLPGLMNKADLNSAYAKVANLGRNASPQEEERYRDAWWGYLCRRLKGRQFNKLLWHSDKRQAVFEQTGKRPMGFHHAMFTDGYSVSLLVTSEAIRGCKEWNPFKERSDMQDTDLIMLSSETIAGVQLQLAALPNVRIAAGDPGKGNILTVVAKDSNRQVTYSAKQRRVEMGTGRLQVRNRRRKQETELEENVPGVEGRVTPQRVEQQLLRPTSSKSCVPASFQQYVVAAVRAEQVLEEFYSKPIFRAQRFTQWMRRDITEMRLLKRIQETFAPNGEPLALFVGAWGRRPNLKHQAPTPGIGLLRRLAHRHKLTLGGDLIWTLLVFRVTEMWTSSFCPRRFRNGDCCDAVVEKYGSHHRLKCTDPLCGTVWRRDRLGARNILRQALHYIDHAGPHPCFS